MLLLNQILFPHTLNSIILLIFLILTKHDLPKSTSPKHLQQLELFESIDIILICLALENDLTLCFHLFILFQTLCIQ